MTTPVKIVFLGTPEFAVPVLDRLASDPRFQIMAVITQEDKPVGRHQTLTASPVKTLALQLNLPVLQPTKLNKDQELLEEIKSWNIDFLVVVAYGQILSRKVLALPRVKAINIHGSILPKYRGASPIEQSLLNSDLETGISIMEMTAGMDQGPVYEIHQIPIGNQDDNLTLRHTLSKLGAEKLPDCLIKIANSEIQPSIQDESQATYCQKIIKQHGQIDAQIESAESIIGKLKAFKPWPGISIIIKEKVCKIIQARISEQILSPGIFQIQSGVILLGTTSKAIQIDEIQMEGKKSMTTEDFLRGNSQLFE